MRFCGVLITRRGSFIEKPASDEAHQLVAITEQVFFTRVDILHVGVPAGMIFTLLPTDQVSGLSLCIGHRAYNTQGTLHERYTEALNDTILQ